jgi:hypothetical protein
MICIFQSINSLSRNVDHLVLCLRLVRSALERHLASSMKAVPQMEVLVEL